jgi:tetratricopeptide (TPR) repeat protein
VSYLIGLLFPAFSLPLPPCVVEANGEATRLTTCASRIKSRKAQFFIIAVALSAIHFLGCTSKADKLYSECRNYFEDQQYERAINICKKALDYADGEASGTARIRRLLAATYNNWGVNYYNARDFDKALELFAMATQYNPDNAEYWRPNSPVSPGLYSRGGSGEWAYRIVQWKNAGPVSQWRDLLHAQRSADPNGTLADSLQYDPSTQ